MLYCSCGFTKEPKEETGTELKETVQSGKKIEVIEQVETHPKMRVRCEKCSNGIAYFWTQQTRGADEPETRFFKCTQCNHTWREYS